MRAVAKQGVTAPVGPGWAQPPLARRAAERDSVAIKLALNVDERLPDGRHLAQLGLGVRQ